MLKEKTWTLAQEQEITDKWMRKELFNVDKNSDKIYSIDTPPPYVNTPIHIGHALTYCYMDFFARYKRMKGYSVVFPLGLDRNGLPIELAAEKKFGVRSDEISREEFLGYCEKILEESTDISINTFSRLGISFSSYKLGEGIGQRYHTDSEEYRRLTQETFIDLWNKDLVYESRKVSNYCPGCKTTIADAEITYEERQSKIYHIKFKVEQDKDIIIATTRPELLGSCARILFNPNDERYKDLNGKHAIIPLFEKEIKIQKHPIANSEFGSGMVMMCSFGDLTDIRFFREEGIKPIISINIDGKMNKNSGFLEGLKVKEAREKIVERLKEENLLVKVDSLKQRSPICERSKDNIEFIYLDEFYLKQIDDKKNILKVTDEIEFYDKNSKQILIDWINTLSEDWPLSRRRYYATPIPLWKCEECGKRITAEKGKYWKPWKESPKEKCECGGKLKGETRVFDTWFDSSISPLYVLGYGREDKFFKKTFPCSLRPQGKEIIRTWLYYTLLRNYQLTKKSAFKDVWINYHVLDKKGKKMSKSLGNIIDPLKIIEKHGSEAFRLWGAIEGNITKQDIKCSEERISAEFKTLNKLWNISKFISSFDYTGDKELLEADKLVINYFNQLITYCDNEFEKYNFFDSVNKIRHFLWEIFASHYLEVIKARAYNTEDKFSKKEQNGAIYTLNYCLKNLLKIMYPVIPAITEKILKELYKEDINKEEFPKSSKKLKVEAEIDSLLEVNSKVWKNKRDNNLSLKAEIQSIKIPKEHENLKGILNDLKAAHNSEEIIFGNVKDIEISLK